MKTYLIALTFIFSTNLLAEDTISLKDNLVKSNLNIQNNSLDKPINLNNINRHSAELRSGGWSGNGGDFSEVADNIWFLGDKKVSYCVQVSRDYLLSKNDLKNLITSSLKKWKSFFHKYDLMGTLTGSFGRGRESRISFLDGVERGVNFNLEYTDKCEKSELQFFFGIENKIIKDYKKYATEHPFGFALRKSYDHETYSNSGLIWIKNNSKVELIEQTLLHELGHIFGMKHDSTYIMRSSLAVDLETKSILNQKAKIEIPSWPYRFIKNSSLSLTTVGKRSIVQGKCSSDMSFSAGKSAYLFSEILKVSPRDCLSVNVKSLGEFGGKKVQFELELKNLTSNKSKLLLGKFVSKRKTLSKKNGPGLFSQFQFSTPIKNKLVWRKLSLDRAENYELSGVFEIGKRVFPAKLVQDKGATVDLFFIQAGRWLTLKSYRLN